MSETLVLLGIIAAALSGLPGLLWRRSSSGGQWVTTLIAVLGAGLGLAGAGWFWATGASRPVVLPWSILGTEFQVALDGLSAIFLAPIFLVSLLGNVYGLGYWKQTEHPQNGRKLRFFYGTMTAGMALLVIARNSIVFLFGWEIMALSAFFLVTTEDEENEVREAGWLYLVATHTATLCLFALFALIHSVNPHFFARAAREYRPASFRESFLHAIPSRPGGPESRRDDGDLRPRLVGLRAQGGDHAAARLAAERPCRGPEPRLGPHVGRPHQDGDLRAGAGDVDAGRASL